MKYFPATYAQTGPVKVEVRQTNGRYELRRGVQPYCIKCAGGGEFTELVRAYGGKSSRT